MSRQHQWETARIWVQSNYSLIRLISSPYCRYMASGTKDIKQEAILTAFNTLHLLAQKGENTNRLGAYFRVMFKTQCIKMATGVVVTDFIDIDQISSVSTEQTNYELDQYYIEQALQQISTRQRRIAQWILEQPKPVSTTLIAEKFGIQRRTVRAILCNAIKRLERKKIGNSRVRKNISITA